jgi:hypothetical protein
MNNKYATSYLDALFCFLMVFVVICSLIKHTTPQESAYKPNAIYEIVLTWEGDADLDLWIQDPQGRKVGFARREGGDGSLCSLNRDCLGAARTETDSEGKVVNPVNEEIATIRGFIPGEFIVNVHSYNMNGTPVPLKAKVKLIKVKPYAEPAVEELEFNRTGEELTFFRFILSNQDNQITIADINRLPAKILNSGGSQGEYNDGGENQP